MRKITTLFALLFVCIIGNAMPTKGWECLGENVTEIIPGEDVYYAIQQGFGPTNAKPIDGYLNSENDQVVTSLNNSCIYNFLKVGEKTDNGEVFNIYVLKNVANGKYLTKNVEKYTASPIDAFQFTARIAQNKEMTDVVKTTWYEYSNAINGGKCPGAEGANWVFCSPIEKTYMTFNNNPGWSVGPNGYVTANNWRVYVATEKPLSAQEIFAETYTKYFSLSVDETNYTVGTRPGCLSQEMYDELKKVYDDAFTALNNSELTSEEAAHQTQVIEETFVKLAAERVPFTPGYYCLFNRNKGFLSENEIPVCDGSMTEMPTKWTIENAKYIWKIEYMPESDTYIYIQSATAEKYISKVESEYALTDKPKNAFLPSFVNASFWNIKDKGAFLHAMGSGHLNNYGKSVDPGNHWDFYPVAAEDFEAIHNEIIQSNLNNKLAEKIKHVEINLEGLKNKCGLTRDGNYANSAAGIVTHFENSNADDTKAGSEPQKAFDRDVETAYQTDHSNKAPQNVRHWVEFNFSEPLQEIVVKFTRRLNFASIPTRIGFYAAEGDVLENPDWTEELYEDTIVYDIPTEYRDTIADSTTVIKKITLSRPVQHVRFTATKTTNDKYWNGGGPTWSLAEMRIYKAENDKENPGFKLIPQDTLNALQATLEKAKNEVAISKATQETLDALNAAMESVVRNLPNPAVLRGAVENAYIRLETAVESDTDNPLDYGYFHPGAKAEYQKALDAIKVALSDESTAMTLEDIENLRTQLENAINDFNKKMIVPETGVYRVVCAAGFDPNTGTEYDQNNSYIASVDADPNTPVVWAYKNDPEIDFRWNTLWYIEKNAEGLFSFKNLATGLYIDNPYEGLTPEEQAEVTNSTHITFSKTPKHITFEASPEAGKIMLTLKSNRFVNASGQKIVGNIGSPMAIWGDYKNGVRSRFTFEAISEIESSFKINCIANNYRIASLPFALQNVYTASGLNAYKVLGVKDNFVQFKAYANNELIPANTPFLLKTGENENFYEIFPIANTLQDLLNVEYNYEPVIQNGMVSAPCEFEIKEGYGMIFQDKIYATAGTEVITAGTGFFNKDIPATTETGDIQMELKSALSGEGTLVETVINNENASNDVYTLAGVKIRQNVKNADALKSLPKGIYIVGDKKVIIK